MDRQKIETRWPAMRLRWAVRLMVIVASTVLLAACGGDSDDAADETATEVIEDAQGTVASGSPAAEEQPDVPSGTPVVASSPVAETDMSTIGTPEPVVGTPAILVPTTDVGVATFATPDAEVPVAGGTPDAAEDPGVAGSDGTGGEPPADDATDEGGDAGALTDSLVGVLGTTVDGCEVASFPPYSGDTPEQVTTIEVNFRSGPGADCEALSDPVADGVAVLVRSDPVTRSGDTENQWIAVTIDGVDGWIVAEGLTPPATE